MVSQAAILDLLSQRPMSSVEMAEILGTTASYISSSIPQLLRYDLIRIVGYTSTPYHTNLRVFALDDWQGPVQCEGSGRVRGGRIPTLPRTIGKALKTTGGPMTVRDIAGQVYGKSPERITPSQANTIRRSLYDLESAGSIRRTRIHVGPSHRPADVWEWVA